VCRSKHVEPLKNFGIINSITKLHLVGISTESSVMHGSMNIKFLNYVLLILKLILKSILHCFVFVHGSRQNFCYIPVLGED